MLSHKIAKIWTPPPPRSYLFDFGTPTHERSKSTSVPPPPPPPPTNVFLFESLVNLPQ